MQRITKTAGIVFAVVACTWGSVATPAGASLCPNEGVRRVQAIGSHLPDCRSYEQVTPVDKNGANPTGDTNSVQASGEGGRLIYLAPAGLPGGSGESVLPSFIARRSTSGWSNEGLFPAASPGASVALRGWSEDLATSVFEAHATEPVTNDGLQLRMTEGAIFQQAVATGFNYFPAGFSGDDSHLIFESTAQLLPTAAPEVDNLYEWNANKQPSERLSLAGVLPDGSTPLGGSFAGSYDWVSGNTGAGGASVFYTQNTISLTGSQVFFTTGGSESQGAGQLYDRQGGVATVHVSASARTEPDPNGVKPAAFMAATPDGSQVFFTSCQKLTNDSTAVSTAEPNCTSSERGQDLYDYHTATGSLTDLTNASLSDAATAGETHGAAVQGVLGTSNDGSYVYFVANGVLASGATPGNCLGIKSSSEEGVRVCNLYVWHNGDVKFIARQEADAEEETNSDSGNWRPTPRAVGQASEKTARVTPDGLTLLFRSKVQLTAYGMRTADGRGCNPSAMPSGEACSEIYRYAAATEKLVCVSCDPSGAAPTGAATLQSIRLPAGGLEKPAAILTRNLSSEGTRSFFETPDPLVSQDTNGVQDVYEWEAAGTGSCEQLIGCLSLLSSGQSPDPSYFADASFSGGDAFLFTSQPLVEQDQDQNVDIYDARVEGGIAAQNESPTAACNGESCRPSTFAPPSFGAPASSAFSGSGNVSSSALASPSKARPKVLTRAQKLAKALHSCRRRMHNSRLRITCERQARKRYAPVHRYHTTKGGHK